MDFEQLIRPKTPPEFRERFTSGYVFIVRGAPDKFVHLITLEDIEARLNEGCNARIPVEVIRGGVRQALLDHEVPWSGTSVRKAELLAALHDGHSFVMRNMSQINPHVAALIDSIEHQFRDLQVRADLHLYVSPSRDATGYEAHRDVPQHKIYLQVIGTTAWRLYRPKHELPADTIAIPEADEPALLEPIAEFELAPGDLFYMPPAVFHKVRGVGGPRVSFSIPFTTGVTAKRVDRTYIPFRQLFEREQHAAQPSPDVGPEPDADATRVA